MAEKTWMILHVDLQCPSCYKKIKKILCKFPQIRDQVYDKPKNLVKISVVCCSPEKIRDKLCCKGGKVIKSIEIVEPSKPKAPGKPEALPEADEPPTDTTQSTSGNSNDRPKPPPGPADTPPPPPESVPVPVPAPVPAPVIPLPQPPVPAPVEPYPVPVGFCCPQCYEGHGGGPCYVGYRRPVPPPSCYGNYYYGYGYNKGWYVSRCDDYFSEENTSACRIM